MLRPVAEDNTRHNMSVQRLPLIIKCLYCNFLHPFCLFYPHFIHTIVDKKDNTAAAHAYIDIFTACG